MARLMAGVAVAVMVVAAGAWVVEVAMEKVTVSMTEMEAVE